MELEVVILACSLISILTFSLFANECFAEYIFLILYYVSAIAEQRRMLTWVFNKFAENSTFVTHAEQICIEADVVSSLWWTIFIESIYSFSNNIFYLNTFNCSTKFFVIQQLISTSVLNKNMYRISALVLKKHPKLQSLIKINGWEIENVNWVLYVSGFELHSNCFLHIFARRFYRTDFIRKAETRSW